MNKKLHGLIATWLIISTLLLAFPKTVFADGGAGGSEKDVNGYHVTLNFTRPVNAGENQFHIQITDALGAPVANAEVEVSAMPVEGMDEMNMSAETPSVGIMTSNSSEMDMAAAAPETGVMKPNRPAADEHSEAAVTVMLEPTMESGEYAGELHFDKPGEWMFNVHFTINGETTQVEFPFEVARMLGANYAVLAGFFGINATVITAAAVLKKRKSIM